MSLPEREHQPRTIRVLIVDDSVVVRRVISRIFTEDPACEVVGVASNGMDAIRQEALLQPDVITMDIEMPGMDGLAATRLLREKGSKAFIIMCSSLTTRGARSTIEALMCGANDYVTKLTSEGALQGLQHDLLRKVKQFFPVPEGRTAHIVQTLPILKGMPLPTRVRQMPQVVAIGVSTGGPTALMKILPEIPANFPLPILIVQHMPPVFTAQLAARLCAECRIEVLEAAEGVMLRAGRALLAPGDFHMRLKRSGTEVTITLDQGERENSCRPAVDVLFRSVGEVFGGQCVAVMMTGMGQDGLRGVEDLKRRTAYVIAQDKASSVVWGMPGAVAEAGLADVVVDLARIVPTLLAQVGL